MSDRDLRVELANSILRTFTSHSERLELDATGHVVVCWTIIGVSDSRPSVARRKRWINRHGQDFYPVWSHRSPWGGTQTTAIAQLVRFVQGKPVLPMSTWEYWASDKVKLATPETLAALREAHWPQTAICVLCGEETKGLDWWNLDGVSGPCCSAWNPQACRGVKGNAIAEKGVA